MSADLATVERLSRSKRSLRRRTLAPIDLLMAPTLLLVLLFFYYPAVSAPNKIQLYLVK